MRLTSRRILPSSSPLRPRARRIHNRNRAGLTLIEVTVVVVLLAIVGGALMKTLAGQQRFYRGTADINELRSQLRQASAIMSSDLRGVSTAGGDIINIATDSAVEFYYTVGSSVACALPSTTKIILPPLTLASGQTLTSWVSRPDNADSVWVFDEGDTTRADDDSWHRYGIASVTDTTGACPAPYTQAADNASASYALTINGATLPASVRKGVILRFVRRAHYSLFRWTDGLWYLGYCTRCTTTAAPSASMQPIAGPFNAYVNPASTTNGVSLTYFVQSGVATSTPANVARISILLRGQTRQLINISGLARGTYSDSIRVDVAVRNRS